MTQTAQTSLPSADVPLFVDLDGTLIRTDVAEEMLVRGMRSAKAMRQALAAYRADGLGGLKRALSREVGFRADLLPYDPHVMDYIRTARAAGRQVILATAADRDVAEEVAAYTGLFDAILASDPGSNLKGEAKLAAIRAMAGNGPFEYLGDSTADLPIWQAAPWRGFARIPQAAQALATPDHTTLRPGTRPAMLPALRRAMRPHQWAKNVLVLAPLLFTHLYGDPVSILRALLAFAVFSICASSVYLLNDVLDIEADRAHPTKKTRPFAAGDLLPRHGVIGSVGLLAIALGLAFGVLGPAFGVTMLAYFGLTTAYSFVLKTYSTVDVVALALLYTLRIIAGAVALHTFPSPWLLTFSMFFFLSLAYLKRYIELSKATGTQRLAARNYWASDLTVVQTFGIANGALSLLTLAEYVTSAEVIARYETPGILWLMIPVMMFWTYRAWMWANRGMIGDDPVVFASKDRISRITGLVVLCIFIAARYLSIPWMTP
ncbi:UbiA family prenyltransferase [Thalassobius vesicularis]|uniref:UbiA family prenyltransferase n=1 Tax=Thalassobius vesicularis TaxID=1294297 RepID=A0A4S3M4X9_9RHOB|nr:UbiA family prenyltransferase [Thalassobius vesicularis]THD71588.1 UbiA family prenyltransferase [Thalassobius vesicularis]